MQLFKRASILGISAFAFVAIAPPALAIATTNEHAQTPTQATEQQTDAADKAAHARQLAEQKQKMTDAKNAAQTRLTDTKLKACQNREKAITNIMSRLADRGQKQLDLFSSIADKTEAFYAAKGRSVTTYDALIVDLTAKKADAQAAVDTIKSTNTTFKCDGTDPKGMVSSFKDSLRAEIAALKEYKTAVKHLIVGVKSAQGVTSTDKMTGEN